jgi:hypothetical protein
MYSICTVSVSIYNADSGAVGPQRGVGLGCEGPGRKHWGNISQYNIPILICYTLQSPSFPWISLSPLLGLLLRQSLRCKAWGCIILPDSVSIVSQSLGSLQKYIRRQKVDGWKFISKTACVRTTSTRKSQKYFSVVVEEMGKSEGIWSPLNLTVGAISIAGAHRK